VKAPCSLVRLSDFLQLSHGTGNVDVGVNEAVNVEENCGYEANCVDGTDCKRSLRRGVNGRILEVLLCQQGSEWTTAERKLQGFCWLSVKSLHMYAGICL
jgi:hypothetical protein